jgi:two-component system chemotaxis response regulator CheB
MLAVSARGGGCLAQAFDEALYDSMPRAAWAAAENTEVLTVQEMAKRLTELVQEETSPEDPAPPSTLMQTETAMADLDPEALHDPDRPGRPSGFACPDCHGALFEITEGSLVRYRCRVGHGWSAESLVARQTVDLESALWMALRSLEEKAALSRAMGDRAGHRGHPLTSDRFTESADETLRAAELVRDLIARIGAGQQSTA